MKINRILIALSCFSVVLIVLIYAFGTGESLSPPIRLMSFALFTGIGACIGYLSAILLGKYGNCLRYGDPEHPKGMAGPQFFAKVLKIEWNRNLRSRQPLSLIIIDIDDFEAFKKAYGRKRTDRCIKDVADVFENHLQRAGDFAAKYGKSQFIGILPDTIATESNFLGEKIREGVEKLGLVNRRATTGKILTISVGTATVVPNAQREPDELINLAEDAIIRAGNSGGNRVVSIDQGEK